jgi:hypothetical protein
VRSVWYSRAAEAIVEAAHARRADLIVMSTHGRSGLPRALRGSVAESVLRRTRTPILLVSAAGSVDVESGPDTVVARAVSSAGPFGPSRSE